MRKLITLLMLLCGEYVAAATLSYKPISTDTFQFMLKNESTLEIGQAQSLIFSAAVQVCQGKKPIFGKYSFESTGPLSNSAVPSLFTFFQEIRCTDQAAISAIPKALEISKNQEETIKASAKKMTERFLNAKDSGHLRDAYDMLGTAMKELTNFEAWQLRETRYINENLGQLVNRDIWRITLYNNPENAPNPGLYIAADYENIYEKSPVHCGYVVWYIPTTQSESFTVVREEYGNITTDMLDAIAKENLQSVRKKLGCRSL